MRKQVEALTEMYRIAYAPTRAALLAGTAKKYVKTGMSEDEAVKMSRRDLLRAFLNDLNREALFGFAMGMIWRFGMRAAMGMLGDDDDELWKDMVVSAVIAPFDGTVMLGQALEAFSGGYGYSPSILDSELEKMYRDIKKISDEDNLISWDAAKLTGNLLLRIKGLNLNSAENIYSGIAGMIEDGMDANDVMLITNMPNSLRREYAGKIRQGEGILEYASRLQKAYKDNEKLFERDFGNYVNKYYFHDEGGDMTRFNRVWKGVKEWSKLSNADRRKHPDALLYNRIYSTSSKMREIYDLTGEDRPVWDMSKKQYNSDGTLSSDWKAYEGRVARWERYHSTGEAGADDVLVFSVNPLNPTYEDGRPLFTGEMYTKKGYPTSSYMDYLRKVRLWESGLLPEAEKASIPVAYDSDGRPVYKGTLREAREAIREKRD